MKKTIIYSLCFLLFACNQATDNNTATATSDKTELEPDSNKDGNQTAKKVAQKNEVYPWVNKLNIRDQAGTKGKVIATANKGDALKLTDTKSEKMETIVLSGAAYPDYWYKISTADGKEGWVFGGAVKQEGESKGNEPMTKEKFDFPYFGKYDVSKWGKIGPTDVSESEESDETLVSYKKGDEILKIFTWSMGEMGYGYRYQLQDGKEEDLILKEREISFSPGFDKPNTLTEIVKDYTQKPAKQYTRVQKVDASRHELKPFPLMALGEWKEEMLDAENDMFYFFTMWPNKDMGVSMTAAEKENLIDITKRKSKNWKIQEDNNHKLFLQSTNPEFSTPHELVFQFFQYHTSTDGVLVAIERWARNHQSSRLNAMLYKRGKPGLEKINVLDVDANDFVSQADKLPSDYMAQTIFYFRDKHTIEVNLYTWMDTAFEKRKIINKVFYDWDGKEFKKRIEKKVE